MYKELIASLTFVYGYIARGREQMTDWERQVIANGAHTMVKHAPAVLGGDKETAQDRADLEVARKVDAHIEDSVVFLQHLEIV